MKLVAISRIKNEIDIVEAFVRHTAELVNALVVLDNGSTDGTLQVLRQLAAAGLPLEVIEDSRPGQNDAPLLDRLMHVARTHHSADWVLPLDADEFLGVTNRVSLEQALAACSVPTLVSWRTYVPDPADDPTELNPVLRIRHRLDREGHRWRKVFVPGDLVERSSLAPGHHDVFVRDQPNGRREDVDEVMALCHVPVRSPAQYAIKVMMGNLRYVARGGNRDGLGFHYEEPFKVLLEDWREFAASHYRAARMYAIPADVDFTPVVIDDPLPYLGGGLQFTPPPRLGEPWKTLIEYAAQLAAHIGSTNEMPDRSQVSTFSWTTTE